MRFLNCGFVIGLGLMTLSCQPAADTVAPILSLTRPAVTIQSLRQPERVEQSLPLSGEVIQRLAVLNGWLYQLEDDTGQIWILTQQTAPAVGEQIYVEGVLRYEPIVINGADLGDYYLEEEQRDISEPQ
ncbi:MAG: hypothetical protein ACFB2W_08240 [Leptolyngbyaceae cyanobacterium]